MTVYLLLFFGGVAIATFRKKDFYIRFTKIMLLFALLFFVLFPNPLDWGNQFARRLGRIPTLNSLSVIEPDKCADLEAQFWDFTNKSSLLSGVENFSDFISHPNVPTLADQLYYIQRFLYNGTEGVIVYEYDWFASGRLAYDHIPTVDEVLSRGTDDCDGIAVVTCSFLTRLNQLYDWNISPYIAESDYHWWTIVFNETDAPILGNEVRRLNWWTSIGDPYYMFNHGGQIYFPNGLFIPMLTVLFDSYMYEDFFMPFMDGTIYDDFGISGMESIGAIIAWPLLIVILFLLAALITLYLNVPRRYKPKKRDLLNVGIGGTALSSAGILLFFACQLGMAYLGSIIVFIAFTATIFTMDKISHKFIYDKK